MLHVAIFSIIAAAVIATIAVAPAVPGNASGNPSAQASAAQPVTAGSAQASAERDGISTTLQAVRPPDSLLLAVLSLEASTTSSEVEASLERILKLGVPQETQPAAAPNALPTEIDGEAQGTSRASDNTDETADSGPPADTEPTCADTGNPAYCVYTVIEGDTLSGIADALGFAGNAGMSAAEMLAQSNKPDVVSSDHIEPGQNIRVPTETGILHTVFSNETASDLAADYGVSLDALLGSPYNAIGGDSILLTGQEVFIPDPAQLPVNEQVEITFDEPTPEPSEPAADATPEPTPTEPAIEPTPTEEPITVPDVPRLGPLDTPTPTPEPTEEPTATPEPENEGDEEETPDNDPPQGSGGASGFFIWPVQGRISSYFGPSHPLGIDIDLYNDPNASIVAARGGTVVFAGGDPCCSYGLYVIIEHENGVSTLYAHLSEIDVSEGEVVSQGERIGRAGRTGYATGNHLHFEIRVNGNVVDPLRYLP